MFVSTNIQAPLQLVVLGIQQHTVRGFTSATAQASSYTYCDELLLSTPGIVAPTSLVVTCIPQASETLQTCTACTCTDTVHANGMCAARHKTGRGPKGANMRATVGCCTRTLPVFKLVIKASVATGPLKSAAILSALNGQHSTSAARITLGKFGKASRIYSKLTSQQPGDNQNLMQTVTGKGIVTM